MSKWRKRRKMTIIVCFITIFTVSTTGLFFIFFYQEPGCFDNTHNGNEQGVDCGGVCESVCSFSVTDPNIVWARALEVGPGVYNLAAKIENPNIDLGTSVPYVFRGYNEENVLVVELFGITTLYPTEQKIIFESSVSTENRKITKIFLEFDGEQSWYKSDPWIQNIITEYYVLENTESVPTLQASLHNTSTKTIPSVVVTAVLYDANESVHQVSQTHLDSIGSNQKNEVFFSWRKPFTTEIQTIEFFTIQEQL